MKPCRFFRERDLQVLWGLGLFRRTGLLTEDAQTVEVDFPGIPSVEGGPDFRRARLRIGGIPVLGDVELHLSSCGWEQHRHGLQGAYDSVVLHVVLERGRGCSSSSAPELVLAPYLERSLVEYLGEIPSAPGSRQSISVAELERFGDRRFERRVARLRHLLRRDSIAQLFYREILVGLGYKNNKAPFEELARLVPVKELQGMSGREIEDQLLLHSERLSWRSRGVRPANRPRKRIHGAARWLASVGTEAPHRPHLDCPRPELFDPDQSGAIGRDRAEALVANVVLPMAVAVGTREQATVAHRIFQTAPAGASHRKIREGQSVLFPGTVKTLRQEFGLMEGLSQLSERL